MKKSRKILSALLSVCMIVTMLPTVAFAAAGDLGSSDKFRGQTLSNATMTTLPQDTFDWSTGLEDVKKLTLTAKEGGASYSDTSSQIQGDSSPTSVAVYFVPKAKFNDLKVNHGNAGAVTSALTTTGATDKHSGLDTDKLNSGDYLVIDITHSSNHNYYFAELYVQSDNVKPSEISIGENKASAVTGDQSSVSSAESVTLNAAYGVTSGTITLKGLTGASVKYIQTSEPSLSSFDSPKEATAGSEAGEFTINGEDWTTNKYFFVEVKSEDQSKTAYYKLEVTMAKNPDATLVASSAKIKGKEVTLGNPINQDNASSADLSKAENIGSVTLSCTEAMDTDKLETSFTATSTDAKVAEVKAYAADKIIAASGQNLGGLSDNISGFTASPDLTTTNKTTATGALITDSITKATNVWVVVKVTAADTAKYNYYVIKVTVNAPETDTSIISGTVDDIDIVDAAGSKGKFEGGTVVQPTELTVTVPVNTTGTYNIALDVASTASKVEYLVAAKDSNPDIAAYGSATPSNIADGKYPISASSGDIDAGKAVYIRVTAQNSDVATYYKLVINKSEIIVDEDAKANADVHISSDVVNSDITTGQVETAAKGIELESGIVKDVLFDKAEKATAGKDDAALKKVLTDAGVKNVNGKVYVHAVATLDIHVKKYDTKNTPKEYTVDITPQYYVAVSTTQTGTGTLDFDGDDKNAAYLTGYEPQELDLAGTEVEVTIPLPESNLGVAGRLLYVKHKHNDKLYIYEDEDQNYGNTEVKFTNKHGFSDITVTGSTPEAQIGETIYETLQEAVDAAVKAGGKATIELLAKPTPATVNGACEITLTKAESFDSDGNYSLDAALVAGTGLKKSGTTNGDGKTTSMTYTFASDGTSTVPGGDTPGGSTGDTTGGGTTGGTTSTHSVKVETAENGTVTASATSNVAPNTEVTLTVKPAEGYVLDKLTAKTDSGQIDLTKKDDTTYTFKMPAADVTVTATFKLASEQKPEEDAVCAPYTDVDSSYVYHDQVHYMIENKLMTGVATNTFGLNVVLNRAMVAQILYSKAEPTKPSYTVTKSFTDVKAGDWFANSVTWAESKGVTAGYGDGTFRPYSQVTREELVTMLYGEAGQPNVTGDLSAYTDASSVSSWAVKPMTWAIENGVVTGTTTTTLSPKNTTPRYQAAIMFYKYFTK